MTIEKQNFKLIARGTGTYYDGITHSSVSESRHPKTSLGDSKTYPLHSRWNTTASDQARCRYPWGLLGATPRPEKFRRIFAKTNIGCISPAHTKPWVFQVRLYTLREFTRSFSDYCIHRQHAWAKILFGCKICKSPFGQLGCPQLVNKCMCIKTCLRKIVCYLFKIE